MTEEELLSIRTFCQRFAISRATAYRLMSAGELPAVKIGKSTRIRSEDAARWRGSLASFQSRNGG
jgi:excisionase family DNA binding protein